MKTSKINTKLLTMLLVLVALFAVMAVSAFADTTLHAQISNGTELTSSDTDVRFIMAIDSLQYDEVGFIVSKYPITGVNFAGVNFTSTSSGYEVAKVNGHTYLRVKINTVYQSINAGGSTVTAASLNGSYLATCKVVDVANANFGDSYRVIGYTKNGNTTSYTDEKIFSVAAYINEVNVLPSGNASEISFNDYFNEIETTGNYVLIGTWKNNVRNGTTTTRGANSENQIAVIPLGQELVWDNVQRFTFRGNVDHLVGAPVEIGFDANGMAVTVKLHSSKTATYRGSDFNITYTDEEVEVDGVKEKVVNTASITLKSGAPLSLELDKLATGDGYKSNSYTGFIVLSTQSFAYVKDGDEFVTLYDTDGNGSYDFYSKQYVLNAALVLEVTDEKVKLLSTYGTETSTGWFLDTQTRLFNYELADGVDALQVGDRVDFTLTIDCTSNTGNVANFPVRLKILSKTANFTGTLQDVTYGNYKVAAYDSGEDVQTDLTIKTNDTYYKWSSGYSKTDYADGPWGVWAGRTAMSYANYGTEYRFYLDTTGHIVLAERTSDYPDVGEESLRVGNIDISVHWDQQGSQLNANNMAAMRRQVKALFDTGYRQISIVYSNPGYPCYAASQNGADARRKAGQADMYYRYYGYERPVFVIADLCHEYGMTCNVVYKPYEGGGGATYPFDGQLYQAENVVVKADDGTTIGTVNESVAYPYSYGQVEGIGGYRGVYDSFLDAGFKKGVDYRVIRRPDNVNANKEATVTSIVVDFLQDAYYYRGVDTNYNTIFNLGAVSFSGSTAKYTASNPHPTYPVVVWTSTTNGTYTPLESYSYQYSLTSEVLKTSNGEYFITSNGSAKTTASNILRLTVSDISLTYEQARFFALSFANVYRLRTLIYSMVHLYDANGNEIASTAANYVRSPNKNYLTDDPEDYRWGAEQVPAHSWFAKSVVLNNDGSVTATPTDANNPEHVSEAPAVARFNDFGFEFNWYPFENLPYEMPVIGIARGVEEVTPGCPCEGYAEVREYWLDVVKEIVDAGFDSVEIRLQSHSTMVSDFYNYGFNEPIVNRYRELYGNAAYSTLMDPTHTVTAQECKRIMEIRGEFFMMFAEEAKAYCAANNVPFSIDLRESYAQMSDIGSYTDSDKIYLSGSMNTPTQWTMPKILIDWRDAVDLSDFVAFKDYILSSGTSRLSSHASDIKTYAKNQGKQIWIECYDEQGGVFVSNFFTNAVSAGRIDNIAVYEIRSWYTWSKVNHEVFEGANAHIVTLD